MALHTGLMLNLGRKGIFDDNVRFGKSLFNIPDLDRCHSTDVSPPLCLKSNLVMLELFMDNRSLRGHGLRSTKNRFQRFVLHPDQVKSSNCNLLTRCSYGRDGIAKVSHLISCKDQLVFQVHPKIAFRDFLACYHSQNAFELLCLCRVDSFDPSMRILAPQYLAVNHVRPGNIITEERDPLNILQRIGSVDRSPDVRLSFFKQRNGPGGLFREMKILSLARLSLIFNEQVLSSHILDGIDNLFITCATADVP